MQLLLNCSKPRAVDVKINDFTLALSDYTITACCWAPRHPLSIKHKISDKL